MAARQLADNTRAAFRANLRRLLTARKISVRAFADLCGMKQSTASELFTGPHYPSLMTICRVCAALAVRPRDILAEPKNSPPAA
jgi:transcriptional regulator with XRE-family HTH domain